jgi:phenylpropionate dioxygenase-like ring-hydroxylating dioxygenase large terminal subunit
MIRNQWYAVLESNEVKRGKPVGVTRLGEKMVFWRTSSGEISCLIDRCPHRGCALRIGKILGDHLQCPFHGFEFDATGRCTLIPANGKNALVPKAMQVSGYPVREAHHFIWVWWGEPQDEYPPLPYFEGLEDGFSYARDKAHWAVHYSRAIENQLDVFHLAFVHDTTIGRGNRTISDGPAVQLNGEQMDIWVQNKVDDGSVALKPDQVAVPQRGPSLKFIFPNMWMNCISEDMRIIVSFVPVDESNTIMYLRYYQRFVRLPILRDIVNLSTLLSGRVILNQDRRVVLTQQPVKTDLRMNEKPITQDRPIVIYRSHRKELIEKTTPGGQ